MGKHFEILNQNMRCTQKKITVTLLVQNYKYRHSTHMDIKDKYAVFGEVLYSVRYCIHYHSGACLSFFILYVCFSSTIFPGWADFTEYVLATAQSRENLSIAS